MSALNANAPTTSAPSAAYLVVRSLDQAFALPIGCVQSIFQIESLSRVPHGPRHLLGLCNLRGRIVAVASLARRLQPDAAAQSPASLAIVVESGLEIYALAVDEIGDVHYAQAQDLIDMPAHIDRKIATIAVGLLRRGSALIPILDISGIFEFRRKPEAA